MDGCGETPQASTPRLRQQRNQPLAPRDPRVRVVPKLLFLTENFGSSQPLLDPTFARLAETCRRDSFCHGCLSPRPSPGATQREMRAAPARALSPRPTTTTAASPCPAARRAATAARAARSEDRGESGTIGLPVGALLSARPRVAFMPTAPPRPPKRARAMLVPFYAADARRRLLRPRRSKTTWARRACRGVLGAGPQAACAASRCGPLEPPFLSIPPLKDALKAERSSTGGPEHDVQQSEQEISRDWPRLP